MGSTKQKTSQRNVQNPWNPSIDNLKSVLDRSATIASDTGNFMPQYSDTYQNALNSMENFANTQSATNQFLRPVVEGSTGDYQAGQDVLRRTASGEFLQGNPYLDAIIARQQENTANRLNQNFSAAGRYGSGAHTGVLTRELGDQELSARYGDYNNERTRQLGAAGTLFGQGFQGSQLGGVLDQGDLSQMTLARDVGLARNQQLDAENTADARAAEWLSGMTTPIASLGGTGISQGTTKSTPSVGSQIMGGLMMGASLLGGGGMGGLMGGLGGAGGLMGGMSGLASGGLMGGLQGYAGMHSPSFWTPR